MITAVVKANHSKNTVCGLFQENSSPTNGSRTFLRNVGGVTTYKVKNPYFLCSEELKYHATRMLK
jgi:hypothetical protein